VLGALLAGCESVAYYGQAAHGHLSLMASRQPVAGLLAEPPVASRQRLALLLEIRDFASETLALPDNGSYRSVVPTPGDAVIWSVVATPPYSLEPRTWCFPVAGCTSYRGYFDRAAADAFASRLAAEGLDVAVDPVPTYSTLGWFDDPMPDHALRWPDHELANLVFHELAHQRLYVEDDSAFNEAFATAVAEAGVERWIVQRGDPVLRTQWQMARARKAAFIDLLLTTRAELITLYGQDLSETEMRAGKTRAFELLRARYTALKASWNGADGFDRWMARPLNNARLAAVATYRESLPAFERLLRCEGGDLPAFYEAAERLAALSKVERDAALRRGDCEQPGGTPLRAATDPLGHAMNTSL
jgi:predicted aminopeptidase